MKRIIFSIVLASSCLWITPAFAAILDQQSDYTVVNAYGSNINQSIAQNITGTPRRLTLYMKLKSGSSATAKIVWNYNCTLPAYTSCTGDGINNVSDIQTINSYTLEPYVFTVPGTVTFDSNKGSWFQVQQLSGSAYVAGSDNILFNPAIFSQTGGSLGTERTLGYLLEDTILQQNTEILSVIPYDNQVISSTTNATIGFTAVLATSTDTFLASNGYNIHIRVYGVNDLLQYAGANNGVVLDYSTTTNQTGLFSFSTTSQNKLSGNYNVDISITLNTLFSVFQPASAATSTVFIAGQPTVFGSYYQQQQQQQSQFFAQMATTSNIASSTIPDACAILTFNLGNCILGILVPTQPQLSKWFDTFKTGILGIVPLGYVTRTITILNGTTTTALPALSFTFPNTFPVSAFAGQTFGFDFVTIGSQASDLVNNTLVSTTDGENVWQIFQTPINVFMSLWLLFIIIADITELNIEVQYKREKKLIKGREVTSWRRNISGSL